MRKLGLIVGAFVGVAGMLLSLTVNANAAAKDEKAISDIEHKMIATTNTDDLMKYYDANDVVVASSYGRAWSGFQPLFHGRVIDLMKARAAFPATDTRL